MGNLLGQRAVVVGAGIGGLSAAAVLAGYFKQVVVVERDDLAPCIGSRSGTPQDRHSHGLLSGGLRALGDIFPDVENDLVAAGAVSVNVGRDIRYERADVGPLPQRDFGRSILCASRPLIEHVLRRRVEALTSITMRRARRVTEILPATQHAAAAFVRLDSGSGRTETLDADLVVDASGRGALTLGALDDLGWDRPEVTEIGVDISYATVVVPIPVNAAREWKVVVTFPDPPALARHAVLLPIEGNRWTVTIADHGVGERLDSWEAFLDAARGLKTPTLYNALRHAERPPEGIRHYGFPASLWRHFEILPRLPRGVLPIADAFCRFNPIHGQGMSSAAKQAKLLLDVLQRSAMKADPIAALQTGFLAGIAAVLQTPWTMSASADFAFPGTRGVKPENFAEGQEFEAALFRAVVTDPVVHRAVMDVAELLAPDSLFQEPDIQRRIEAASARAVA
jgi:2-polyprenyl-6-methoxyphenol hydroxylase-like FAD-dependent oxidoreductase